MDEACTELRVLAAGAIPRGAAAPKGSRKDIEGYQAVYGLKGADFHLCWICGGTLWPDLDLAGGSVIDIDGFWGKISGGLKGDTSCHQALLWLIPQ